MSKRSRGSSPSGVGASAHAPQSVWDAAASERLKTQQNELRLTREGPVNADTTDFCGAFASLDMDNSWDFKAFKKGFSINIKRMDDEVVEFDMIGIDPPLANALRRILIAEVSTVAISRVTIFQNTGVIHDENLAHRLGLVPIVFEPEYLEWKAQDSDFTTANSLMFRLKTSDEQERRPVYSKQLEWVPMNDVQRERFKDDPPRPVADDILLAILAPGQEIDVECHCERGLGKEHAKWSPVSTAFYRLMPKIGFSKDIVGDEAEKLKQTCPMGVFDIEDVPKVGKRAVVADARKCTTCRECLESFPGEERGLLLGKHKTHYLFTIESTGSIPAPELFQRAITQLRDKCTKAKAVLEKPSKSG